MVLNNSNWDGTVVFWLHNFWWIFLDTILCNSTAWVKAEWTKRSKRGNEGDVQLQMECSISSNLIVRPIENRACSNNMFRSQNATIFFYWESFLGCIFKPTDLSNNIKKVWSRSQTATFSLNVGHQFWRQNFNHSFWGQFVHRVILMVTPWKITELLPSEFVDPLDDL